MKYILGFLFFVLPLCSYSQIFIGDSRKAVKAVLHEYNVKFTEEGLTDTTSRISWLMESEFQAIWVLDNNDKVIKQTLCPENDKRVNELVTWFNRDFVIVSDTEWKNYSQGILYHIKLAHILDIPLFTITLKRMSE